MHLNITHPIDFAPNHQLEFLENMYYDAKKNTVRVVWLEHAGFGAQAVEKVLASEPKEFLTDCLSSSQLFIDRETFATDAYVKRLKFKFEESSNLHYIECSIEAAPYFGLPNKNPKEELLAVRNFLYTLKDIFADYYKTFPTTQENLRLFYGNSNGKSIEGFEFAQKKLPPLEQEWLNDKEKAIKSLIESDDNLKLWVKHTYSMLQKIGPHSWCTFTTESFFDEASDPYQPILKQIIANKNNAKKSGLII